MFLFKKAESNPELVDLGIHYRHYRYDYEDLALKLNEMIKRDDQELFYYTLGVMGKEDLFTFMYFILGLPVNDPFIIQRIYDVQDCHNKTIDLWAREHWKSMIITFSLTIWTWLHQPEARQCIFSHTKSIAKAFLRQIKKELESNDTLKICYPDIFWENPERDTQWSEDTGLLLKRKTRAKEASLECSGLVDGIPTSKHYTHRIYDDIIDAKNVSTPAQQKKAKDAYMQTINLGARKGQERVIGTRYGSADVYEGMIKEKGRVVRIFPAEVDKVGKAMFNGTPVFLTREELKDKFEKQSEFIYSSQMLQDPVAKSEQKFRLEWLKYYKTLPYLNYYMIVDPAGKKAVGNDYTVIVIIGVDSRRNYYLVDMVRDKLNLGERWTAVKDKVQEWGINAVGYESYGMQADIDYIQERQEADGVYFAIEPLGGQVSKQDRIKRLIPIFSRSRFYLPFSLPYTNVAGVFHELIMEFLNEEYEKFPFTNHDDMLDCMARILDSKMLVTFPTRTMAVENNREEDSPFETDDEPVSWMSI